MTSAQNGPLAPVVVVIVSFLFLAAGVLTPGAAYSEQPRENGTRTVSPLNTTTRATLIARWILGPQAFRNVVPLYAYDLVDVCPLFPVDAKALPNAKTSRKDPKESPRKDPKESPRKDPKESRFDVKIAASRKDPKESPRKDPKESQFSASAREVLSGEVALVTANRDRGNDSSAWIAQSIDGTDIVSLCKKRPPAGARFVAKEYPLRYLSIARVFLQN